MATDVSTAKFDTLEEFTQCYTPGTANRITASGQPLWMVALTNKNPENRYAIVSYLLDDGGDPAGTNEDGGNGLHILFGRYDHRGVPATDVALVERLLAGGADPNAEITKWGTPVQTLIHRLINQGEGQADPYYQALFARDGLDLFTRSKTNASAYLSARSLADRLPHLWDHVQHYIDQHHLTIPDNQKPQP